MQSNPSTQSIKQQFEQDGFYILPKALQSDHADTIVNDLESLTLSDNYIGLQKRTLMRVSPEDVDKEKFRFKDLHINNANVRSAFFQDSIVSVLAQLLEEPALLFQSLCFKISSGLRIHRDSNYVSTEEDEPRIVACWIALEDITLDTGYVSYYPGSHRLEKYIFSDGNDRWVKSDHGIFANEACHEWNEAQMNHHHIKPESFLAKKGDCIFWDFNLMHQASLPVNNETRYSLVAHFCPESQMPFYMHNNAEAKALEYSKSAYFSSNHYPLGNIDSVHQLESEKISPLLPAS